ncbi:Crp/Fnr family transcriptional regulator [Bradyrhizobium genosp. L]|uniref:Crp/Fnr family transcriptional regulator n=1 Tax=Bradyrhizobium genosp. L TaxID=83637 RepID=UPI0018A31CB0|nr:Crp/Fnr family transcriptional regulator [Bradyrhizobium genosp. L]QPF82479.1 Crp/Fnr family transcriptional regulator [Bradyrhizobium genosp. L]
MAGTLSNALLTKITVSNKLDGDDIETIKRLPIERRDVGPREIVVHDGSRPTQCCLVADGFMFRSKTTSEGQRQILSLHIPGDIPDLQSLYLGVMDHDLVTLTSCTLGFIPHQALKQLTKARPDVAAAMWRETLIDAAMFREWIVNVGRRSGVQRMAHLLSELRRRLEAIGRTANGTFRLPITQAELADCLALSTVHVNRVLQELRGEGLIEVDRSAFHLLDQKKLEERGQFEPHYLHLSQTS